jgi:MoxR-like ATPase
MSEIYIERLLVADQSGTEKSVSEVDILSLGLPLVVLGDPGMGKTKLTESLAARLGARRISAGTFNRTTDLNSLKTSDEKLIIIDGLDELTGSNGASAVDDVLKKLSAMGYPPLHPVLPCC